MAKFVYKFDSLKRIKKLVEKKTQKELMVIIAEIQKKHDSLKLLKEKKQKSTEEIKQRKHVKIADLKFQQEYEKFIDEEIHQVQNEIKNLMHQRELKMRELAVKRKETKVFETLEERLLEDFLYENNRIEQKEIDEIANLRYVRS